MKPLDLTKPIQTRDGRPAKFLHKLDDNTDYCMVFVVGNPGQETIMCARPDGMALNNIETCKDILNVPVKHVREYWVNLYPEGRINFYYNEPDAKHYKMPDCIACKKITIEFFEGEGLT